MDVSFNVYMDIEEFEKIRIKTNKSDYVFYSYHEAILYYDSIKYYYSYFPIIVTYENNICVEMLRISTPRS